MRGIAGNLGGDVTPRSDSETEDPETAPLFTKGFNVRDAEEVNQWLRGYGVEVPNWWKARSLGEIFWRTEIDAVAHPIIDHTVTITFRPIPVPTFFITGDSEEAKEEAERAYHNFDNWREERRRSGGELGS